MNTSIFKRGLSGVLALVMLVGMLPVGVLAEETTEHVHAWDAGTVTAPGCESSGYTTYTCSGCTESYTADETSAVGHSWDAGVVTAPTCDAVGYTTFTCLNCGGTYTDHEVDATGHSWGEGVVSAPTCDVNGCTTYTCTVCGGTKTEDEVPALGHKWDEGVVSAPTCDVNGCTTYTCTVCGGTRSENEVPALGHSWGDWTEVLAPTALAEGSKERTCATCSGKETEAIEKLPPVLAQSVTVTQEQDYTEVLLTDELQLTATVLPGDTTDKNVIWTSSDEAIATVDETGLVTGVALGEVTITAACGEVKGEYVLSVVMPENVTLEENPYSGTCGVGVIWMFEPETGTLTISGNGQMYNYSWSGGPWPDFDSIKSVVIEEGVTYIGECAFYQLSKLESVTISSTVTSIYENAFGYCTSLKRVVIPSNVMYISSHAFAYCDALTDIVFLHTAEDEIELEYYAFRTTVDTYPKPATGKVRTTVFLPYYPRSINQAIYTHFNTEATASRITSWDNYYTVPVTGISLRGEDGASELEMGESLTVIADFTPVYPTNAVIWTVSDPEMGELKSNGDSAVFVGRKEGTVTVRCASADDGTIYGEIQLTILPPTGELTGMSVRVYGNTANEIELDVPTQMVVDFVPGNARDRDVKWELVNGTGSATIDENTGVVTPLTPGTVVITATSRQNPSISGHVTAEILRYVEDIDILLNGRQNVTQIGVGESMMLSALIAPEDAKYQSDDMVWSLTPGTGSAKLKIESDHYYGTPYITGATPGTVTLTATSPDSQRCSASITLEVTGEEKSYAVNGGNIYYNSETGVITRADSTVTSANIPAQIDGTTITGIAPEAFVKKDYYYGENYNIWDNNALTYVKLPDTVTHIGDKAFLWCKKLSVLELGSGVQTIGEEAFYNCESIASLTIPESVTSIGKWAFNGLSGLKNLKLSGKWDTRNWLGSSYNQLETVTFTGTRVISQPYEDYGNGNYGVTSLSSRSAKKVIISDSVTTIEDYAFYSSDMTELVLGSGVQSIGDHAFDWCRSLTNVTMGSSVQSIGDHAFNNCESLTNVTMGSSVQSIGEYAFNSCDSLTNVTMGSSVQSIGEYAFSNCYSLTQINLPDSLTYIGKRCFEACEKLQIIDLSRIPDTIMAKTTSLSNMAIVPNALVSGTNGAVKLYWDVRLPGDNYGDAGEIAGVYRDMKGNYTLEARSTGTIILECYDEYTRARGSKEISIETGIEIRGIPGYLVSGNSVSLTAYRMPDNIQENVQWSLREEDAAYASLSTGYGKTVKLTAQNVESAVQIQLTAMPLNGRDETVANLWVLPKATGVSIFEGEEGEDPTLTGQTGMAVQTLSVDMFADNTLNLSARMQPADALNEVTWKSSDTKIATVTDGVVTMLKPGTVTITATTKDGTNKSASVKLAVSYLDEASRLTAAVDAPAAGLQSTYSAVMSVYGADKTVPMDPQNLTFSIAQNQQDIAKVDGNGVITAGTKAGTVTVTAAINGDPLRRTVSCNVKVVPLSTNTLELTSETVSLKPVVHGGQYERYELCLDKEELSAGLTFRIDPLAKAISASEEEIVIHPGMKWTTTDSRVAAVKANSDGSAVVTIKAKTDGACVIEAVTTDGANIESMLTIYVRDYAPRLESSSLTLNTNYEGGVSTELVTSYDREILGVSLQAYDSKTKTYQDTNVFTADHSGDVLTINTDAVQKNGTYKLLLKATCRMGEEETRTYEYPITLKVSNTLPGITVKQPAKFNLHTGELAELTVTAANAVVEEVKLAENGTDSFTFVDFDQQTGILSLALTREYCDGAKLDAKLDLDITLTDYRQTVHKTVTVSTTSANPRITIKQTLKPNLFYKNSEGTFEINAEGVQIEKVEIDPESTDTFVSDCDSYEDRFFLWTKFSDAYQEGAVAKPDTKVDILIYLEGYNVPIRKSVTIGTVNTKPNVSLTASSSVINTVLSDVHTTAFWVWNNTAQQYVSAAALDVAASFADGTVDQDGRIRLVLHDAESRGGAATITAKEENWMSPIVLTHKVTVETREPVATISTSILKLNRVFTEQIASATIKLNQSNLTMAGISIEATKASTMEQTDKLEWTFDPVTGSLTCAIKEGVEAPKNGTYEFRYVVSMRKNQQDGGDIQLDGTAAESDLIQLKPGTVRVNIHSTVPTVKMKNSLLKLNTVLEFYGETAQTAVNLTGADGYELVDFRVPEYDGIEVSFEDGFLLAKLTAQDIALKKHAISLTPVVEDTRTGQKVDLKSVVLTVQTYKTLPVANVRSSTLKLNAIFTEQTPATEVYLNQTLPQIAWVDIVSTAKEGSSTGIQAEKIQVEYDADLGVITASFVDEADLPKNGTYSFYYTVHLEDGTELARKTIKVNVHTTVPGVKLAAGTLKLNKLLEGFAQAQTTLSLTNGTGYELVDMILPEHDYFSLDFDEDGSISVQLTDDTAPNKTYPVMLIPIVKHTDTEQSVELNAIRLNVQIYSGKPSVSVSAKGKLDTMDPESAVIYTVNKITNAAGTIDGVWLEGTDAELFDLTEDYSGAKPTVKLTLVSGADCATNKTYKLQLVFSISGQQIPVNISVKVSQSSLKFGSIPTLRHYQFQTWPVTFDVTLTNPAGAKLEDIQLNTSKTTAAFLRAMGSGEMSVNYADDRRSAIVKIHLDNPGYLVYGKSYTVYLDVIPENNASNAKATQVKLTVKAYK